MWCKKRKCKKPMRPIGHILVALGVGLFLAYIIPYYLLIALLGIALIGVGIYVWCKK
ncbi:MAG: hypothetical protein RSB38_07390 [Oscillospiraceae bacterium]